MADRARIIVFGGERPSLRSGLAVSAAAVGVATAAIYPLKSVAPAVSLSVVYLPAVLLVSAYWGLWLGLFTSLLSAAAFNWFHIPPIGRFTIADEGNWVALTAFVLVAAAVGVHRGAVQAEAVETAALRRSDGLKTALLRAVSHDLRTPLTAMVTAGHALGSETLTREEREQLSTAVVEEGERLSALIEKL